jgi:hypothetical protein
MGFACSSRVQYEYSNRSFCWWQVVNAFKSYNLQQALQRDIGASQHTVADDKSGSTRPPHKLQTLKCAGGPWQPTHRRTACENWILMRRVAGTEPLVPAKVKASAGIK